jgi:CubicO group peptidase (beta-lactamase class C family)
VAVGGVFDVRGGYRRAGYRLGVAAGVGRGGVCIHAEDQALVGQLMLQDGVWNGQRILPEGWVGLSTTPCAIKADYGLLWWLNPGGVYQSNASGSSYFAIGAGGN